MNDRTLETPKRLLKTYEIDQIVQNNLLGTMNEEMCAMREEMCAMTKQLGQLNEMLKSSSAAHKKLAAKNGGPTYWLKLNFASSQMGTLQKILESNGLYGPPPKQPIHNSRMRAGLRSLCKYNFDRKDYLNQETKQNKILAKSSMATFTKSTMATHLPNQQRRWRKNRMKMLMLMEILAKPVLLVLPASSKDKTASSENFSA
jgi:uncharacterized coiled-coil protein SlyX